MRVFICGYNSMMADFVNSIGYEVARDIDEADRLLFTGGADVSPALYGEEKHPLTHCSPARDHEDMGYWVHGIKHGIPMVGICRGAQFLNVMNNGKLHQQVEGHTRNHVMYTLEAGEMIVSSTHHQMIILPEKGAELLGWAFEGTLEFDIQPEVVYYSKSKSLAVQYHPEYMSENAKGFKYFKELMESKFN